MNVHQKAKAIRLWNLKLNTAAIARAIKAPEYEVFNYLREVREQEIKGRPVDNMPGKAGTTTRRCLSCLEEFQTEHRHVRVCKACKRREAWSS